jgi:peptide/nickel transport system substrate-binding protein
MSNARRFTRLRSTCAAGAASVALVSLALVGGAAIPAANASQAAGDDDGVFTVGVLQDVDNLNPFKGITAAAYECWALMYDTLTGYGVDFEPEPRLAASWEQSDDGLEWTYNIRQGVTFHDGEPLTADDVAYTFNRILDGKLEKTNYGSYVSQIKTVEAPDEATVVMTLKKPTPIMERLSIPILPEHIWSKISDEELRQYTNEPDSDPPGGVGTGPFILTEAREGQYYTFERNDDYWAGPAHIDGVEFRLYRNGDAMVQALKNGEIDFADDLDANLFDSLENVENITARSSDYYGFNYLTFNAGAQTVDGEEIGTGHPSLKDPQVRLAIHHAVDKEALVDRTLDGRGSPGTTIIPPLYPEHAEPEDPVTYDPDEANRILDEAGYAKGGDGIRTMPDGSDPLVYNLYSRSNSETSQTTIKFLQGWLEDIGIKANVEVVSETRLYEIAGEGTFDMYEWGWIVEPDPDYQLSTFTCGQFSYEDGGTIYAGLNDAFYCDKRYDELYQQQATETDRDARTAIVKEMQLMAYEANAYIVTEYYDYLQAYRSDRYTGFVPQPDPDGAILFQYGIFSYMNIQSPSEENANGADATESSGSDAESSGSASNSESSDSGSSVAPVVWGLAAVVVIGAVAGWFLTRRRRGTSADVE